MWQGGLQFKLYLDEIKVTHIKRLSHKEKALFKEIYFSLPFFLALCHLFYCLLPVQRQLPGLQQPATRRSYFL